MKYNFNKWIFRTAIGLMVVYFIIVGITFGFTKSYYYQECPKENNMPCHNMIKYCMDLEKEQNTIQLIYFECDKYKSLIENCDELGMCEQDMIQQGEHLGTKPPAPIKYASIVFILLIALAFLVNHIVNKLKRERL